MLESCSADERKAVGKIPGCRAEQLRGFDRVEGVVRRVRRRGCKRRLTVEGAKIVGATHEKSLSSGVAPKGSRYISKSTCAWGSQPNFLGIVLDFKIAPIGRTALRQQRIQQREVVSALIGTLTIIEFIVIEGGDRYQRVTVREIVGCLETGTVVRRFSLIL